MTVPAGPFTYQDRLTRVVDYIHDHLEDELSLDRLADVACLSPYHWHRIYTAMCGETIAATVKRLRLQRASGRLANSDMAVKEVARRAGYGTVESFTRAFRAVYDLPPADYRARGSHAAFKAATAAQDSAGFPVSIETLPEQTCTCVTHRGSYLQIDRAFGTLFAELAAQGLLTPEIRMVAQFFDDPDLVEETELQSMACAPMQAGVALAPPLQAAVLRGGRYARLRYQGPYADMKGAYRWLYGVWLPQSGEEAADAPAFEAYLNTPQEVAQTELRTDIHLPLEAAS
jgi:AraC family transcriptional regulator